MTFPVRDGKFDVAVVAGPRLEVWPSPGVQALTSICAEMGLTAGIFGGETLNVRGVIPHPTTGGLVLVEDVQRRIHRIDARAVVRVSPPSFFPPPFSGWRSEGLIPISTAARLRAETKLSWDPATVILGTGSRALRFGSELLESGALEVFCIETHAQWGAKRFSGWEVERRRFEMAGGKLIEAKPVSLALKSAMLWEFKVQDAQGVRILEVARVVSAGPFRDLSSVREYPAGSFLFEMEQTALTAKAQDVEGWVLEEERGRYLGAKIARALAVVDAGEKREWVDRMYRRARSRLKRYYLHREAPFTPAYQGKWVAPADARTVKDFSGVPQKEHRHRPVASIECFEQIPCNLCAVACPVSAIQIGKVPREETPILIEDRCTACGLCLNACPSAAPLLVQDREDRSTSQLTLPWRGVRKWRQGEFATLLNRRGESLGSGRVTGILETDPKDPSIQLVQVEVPTHLAWEARGLRRPRGSATEDEAYLSAAAGPQPQENKVEITFNGERRLVRDQVPVTIALFETGRNRPEDALFCKDGSCGLCMISIDGVKKLACQTSTRRGMAIRFSPEEERRAAAMPAGKMICSCLGITEEQVIERLRQGKLRSTEAVISVTHMGEGRCHGQVCQGAFRRLLSDQGLDPSQWIDWRFPWSDWILTPHN